MQAQAEVEPGLLRQTSIHAHDLVVCFIQQAAYFAVPFQHVSWNLQEPSLPQHILFIAGIPGQRPSCMACPV